MSRYPLSFALSFLASGLFTFLLGCSGSPSSPASTAPTPPAQVTPTAKTIFVVQQAFTPTPGVNQQIPSSTAILEFPATASGNVSPTVTITPPAGVFFSGVTLGTDGHIYALGYTATSAGAPTTQILVYPASASGAATPLRTIVGDYNFNSDFPTSITTDAAGNIYLGQHSYIEIYKPSVSGVSDPSIWLAGPQPNALAVDSTGSIYDAERSYPHSINVYSAPAAPATPTPARTITDYYDQTNLDQAVGLTFDAAGMLYTTFQNTSLINGIQVYPSTASGPFDPTRLIAGSATTLVNPTGIAVDSAGFIYVADYATGSGNQRAISPSVKVFSPTANGDIAPVSAFTSMQWTGPGLASIAIQ